MMTQTSRKRSRASNEEEASDFMPISKRINNLHIRSGTVMNSDDEGQEDNAAKPPKLGSNGDVHPTDPRFLSTNNPAFLNAGLQAAASTSANHHPNDMECATSSNMPALYVNGHQHLYHAGELQHQNGATNDGMCAMTVNMQHWTNAQMYQEPVNYEPDLDENQNPYYYHVNEMLYDLHVARMQRISKESGHLHLG